MIHLFIMMVDKNPCHPCSGYILVLVFVMSEVNNAIGLCYDLRVLASGG
jgi:hypothetical protein